MATLEQSLREQPRQPIGQTGRVPGVTRAQCHACGEERWVTADGRLAVHDNDGAWCNGSGQAVRT